MFEDKSKYWKNILFFAFPIIILGLVNASYTIIDTILAEVLINPIELGGNRATEVIGLIFPVASLFMAFAIIFNVAVALGIPKKLKQKDRSGASLLFGNSTTLALLFGLIIIIILPLIATPWINWIGSKGSGISSVAKTAGRNYIITIAFSIAFSTLRDNIIRTLRSEGYSVSSSFFVFISVPLNLLLDYVFMGPLGMTLLGAGLATLIATFFSLFTAFLYSIYLSKDNKTIIKYSPKYFKLDSKEVKNIFLIGTNSFVRRIFSSLFFFTMSISIVSLEIKDTDSIIIGGWKSFFTIFSRLIILSNIISLSISQSISIFLSYNISKNDEEAKKNVKQLIKIGFIYIFSLQVLVTSIIISIGKPIIEATNISIDSENKMFINAFYILCSSLPILSLTLIPNTFFASTKDIKSTLLNSFLSNVVFGIFVIVIFYFAIFKKTNNTDYFCIFMPVSCLLQLISSIPIFLISFKKNI